MKIYKIETREMWTLRDVLDAFHDFAVSAESTKRVVRSTHRYVDIAAHETDLDNMRWFLEPGDSTEKRHRVKQIKAIYSEVARVFMEHRPLSTDKLWYHINTIQRALTWANDEYGCAYIVVDKLKFLDIKKAKPPVLTIPINQVNKVLRFSSDKMYTAALEETLNEQYAAGIADALFLAKTILITALRPSDAAGLRRDSLVLKDNTYMIVSTNRKTGKKSYCVVPVRYAKEFIKRCEKSSNRPMTMLTELWEIKDNRPTVGAVKAELRGVVRPYTEQKEHRIFKYNQHSRIEDDDYYIRTYGGRLFRLKVCGTNNTYPSYLNAAIRLCGVKFNIIATRLIGHNHIKEPYTEQDVSAYWLRRTAITRLLSADVSPDVVRVISGHSASSQSFQRYVDASQVLSGPGVLEKLTKLNS